MNRCMSGMAICIETQHATEHSGILRKNANKEIERLCEQRLKLRR